MEGMATLFVVFKKLFVEQTKASAPWGRSRPAGGMVDLGLLWQSLNIHGVPNEPKPDCSCASQCTVHKPLSSMKRSHILEMAIR
jgi:hypothetical protein